MKSNITHDAADSRFNFYGRWNHGKIAVSINSGSMIEFAYDGNTCTLVFDVKGFSHFPGIFVQADNGPVVQTTLSSSVSNVHVHPAFNHVSSGQPPFKTVNARTHFVRLWIATHSLYQTEAAGKQWKTLTGACRFLGADLGQGNLLPIPYSRSQIEFLGDSITQGLRLLYTGNDDDIGHQLPYANWPQLVADLLCMKPVVTGFGGQGLSVSGTCGVPPTNEAFPYIYNGIKYIPSVKPRISVIYQGTNDGVPSTDFEKKYTVYLESVLKAYGPVFIFAVCPHNKLNYALAIMNAVASVDNSNIKFLDYSTGVISPEETCDGCHLNPGSAVKLAVKLSADIQNFVSL